MTERRNRGWDLDPTSTTGERSLDQVPTTNDWKPHIKWTGVLYQKPRSCVQRMLLWPPDTSHHRHTERPTRCRWVWRQRPRLRRITNTNGEAQEVDPPKREKWPNINKTRPRHTGFLVSRRLMICRERERGREGATEEGRSAATAITVMQVTRSSLTNSTPELFYCECHSPAQEQLVVVALFVV